MTLWRRIYEEHKRLILPLALVLIANLAVLGLAVLPLQTSVAAADAQAIDASLSLAEARQLDRRALDARKSQTQADAELSKFYTDVLPRDLPTATKAMNLWLQQAALDAGLDYKGAHFDYAPIRDSRLSRAASTITLEGRYQNLRRFLYALESAKEFIVVEKVEVAESSDVPTAAANGVVRVEIVVSTYFLTPADASHS